VQGRIEQALTKLVLVLLYSASVESRSGGEGNKSHFDASAGVSFGLAGAGAKLPSDRMTPGRSQEAVSSRWSRMGGI